MDIMAYIWAGAFLVFLIVEGATAGLATIWFAAGSFVSFILSLFKVPIPVQIAVFIVVSIVLLIFTRPIAAKFINRRKESTNFDRIVGQTAVVTEKIDVIKGTGRILVSGQDWAAKTSDGTPVDAQNTVIIEKIEGAKVIVKTIQED